MEQFRDPEEGGHPEAPRNSNSQNKIKEENQLEDDTIAELGTTEKFFGGIWNTWVHKLRYVIIFLMAGWLVFAIIMAKDIGPLTEQENFLPVDHPITIVQETMRNKFPGSSINALKVYIFWGVKDIITDDVGSWDASNLGKVQMDENFSLSSIEAQQNILNFCEDLKT